MSKHIFEQTIDEQTYEVQIGWDKPMQWFYFVISPWVDDLEMVEGGYFDDPIACNLFREKPYTLEEITEECTSRGFTLPDSLLENVLADKRRNAINEVTLYDEGGIPERYHKPSEPL